jgi:hypothetical protein
VRYGEQELLGVGEEVVQREEEMQERRCGALAVETERKMP